MKLWWLLRSLNSLWVQFMRNRYNYKEHVANCTKRVRDSSIWLRIMKNKDLAEDQIRWIIRKGDIIFGEIGSGGC